MTRHSSELFRVPFRVNVERLRNKFLYRWLTAGHNYSTYKQLFPSKPFFFSLLNVIRQKKNTACQKAQKLLNNHLLMEHAAISIRRFSFKRRRIFFPPAYYSISLKTIISHMIQIPVDVLLLQKRQYITTGRWIETLWITAGTTVRAAVLENSLVAVV